MLIFLLKPKRNKEREMPAQVLVDLDAAVTKAKGAMESATVLINGIAARIQDAVNAALAGGATAAELAPIQAEVDALNADSSALAAAVAANPVPPVAARRP